MVTDTRTARELANERATHQFGKMVDSLRYHFGLSQKAFQELTAVDGFDGYSPSVQTNWTKRAERGTSLWAVQDICETFCINYHYALKGTGPMFAHEWTEFCGTLTSLMEAHIATPAGRLAAIWNMISQSQMMSERAWAAWLRCFEVQDVTYAPKPTFAKWDAIKGGSEPNDATLRNCAMLTGLPYSWLKYGQAETPSA